MIEKSLLLRARGVSKSYPLDDRPARGLLDALSRQLRPDRGIEVLKGVDLDVHTGESVGILGRNGAGKTTLLSILGGVIDATNGAVERFGAVSSILGTGERLQSELTGYENAVLFCDTLGLGGQYKANALTEIEKFAELGDYFRRPLRTYSSGMRGRLGFACAANVHADLIIIDEVLSVGDIDFRQKCLSFIERQQQRGVTYLVVTHSVGLVASMCSRVIVLDGGAKLFDGPAREGVAYYRRMIKEARLERALADPDHGGAGAPIGSSAASAKDVQHAMELLSFEHHEPTEEDSRTSFSVAFRANKAVRRPELRVAIGDDKGIGVAGYRTKVDGPVLDDLAPGAVVRLRVAYRNRLVRGRYYYRVGLASVADGQERLLHYSDVAGSFDVEGPPRIGLVDLEMEALQFSIETPGDSASAAPGANGIAFFLHLPGDISSLKPIVAAAANHEGVSPRVVVHPRLLESAPGLVEELNALGAKTVVVDPAAPPETWLKIADDCTAWVFACETSLRPHLPAHGLALAARRSGKATFTLQHGLENVGLTFFDDIHDEGVRFGSAHVMTWHPESVLPSSLSNETREKLIPVGRPKLMDAQSTRAPAWPLSGPIDVAIFENIHWHRYSEVYREHFLSDLKRLCDSCPALKILVRPHPQGRWLTERFKGEAPRAANLIIADPLSSEWRDIEAPTIIENARLVVTTPSTVALDAAQASAAVALLAYDLDLPLYEPLMMVRSFEELLAIAENEGLQQLAREQGQAFAERVVFAGPAAERALSKILELSA